MTMVLVETTTMFDGNNEKSGTTDYIGMCAIGCCPQDYFVSVVKRDSWMKQIAPS